VTCVGVLLGDGADEFLEVFSAWPAMLRSCRNPSILNFDSLSVTDSVLRVEVVPEAAPVE